MTHKEQKCRDDTNGLEHLLKLSLESATHQQDSGGFQHEHEEASSNERQDSSHSE
jgi:hypothetical protein